MRAILLMGAAVVFIIAIGSPANRAAAMVPASPPAGTVAAARDHGAWQQIHWTRRHSSLFAPREYWQWDARPIWDNPWAVLRPNFWGSPEPHLVPADIWACEWHLPYVHPWRWHRWRCHPHARWGAR